jgi:hypothetical protein
METDDTPHRRLEKDRPVYVLLHGFLEYIRSKPDGCEAAQNGSTWQALIPVVLTIAECDQKQVNQAMRC